MVQGLSGATVAAMLTEGLFGGMRNLKVSLFISSSGELGGFFFFLTVLFSNVIRNK